MSMNRAFAVVVVVAICIAITVRAVSAWKAWRADFMSRWLLADQARIYRAEAAELTERAAHLQARAHKLEQQAGAIS